MSGQIDACEAALHRAEAAEAERDLHMYNAKVLSKANDRLAAALAEAQARIEVMRAHLGAAKVQIIASDDTIIADHIRDAYDALAGKVQP